MSYITPTISKADLLECAADNMTPTQAAARLGVSAPTIAKYTARWKITLRDGRRDEAARRLRTRRVKMDTAILDVKAGMTEVEIADKYGVPLHRAVFAVALHKERCKRERNEKAPT